MKSKTVCVAFLAILIMPCYVQAGLFDGIGDIFGGITNTIGGLIGGVVDLLASIPKGIASLLSGLLGSSKKGDLITLHSNLRILITKLPSEIKSGGINVALATIQTVLQLIGNLIVSIGQGKTNGVANVLQDIQIIIQILQDNIPNPGARAVLANVYIQLGILMNNMQSSGMNANQIVGTLKAISASLTNVLQGVQNNTSAGGLTGPRDLLQSIFFTFNMLQQQLSAGGSASLINGLLQQLTFLLDGLELVSANTPSANILRSISMNLYNMLHSTAISFTNDDILSFIRGVAISLNLSFDLSGITGTGNFIGGAAGNPMPYLQQISVVFNNLQNSINSNNLSSIQPLIIQLVKLLGNLQSTQTSLANLNTLSTLIINLQTVSQKLATNSISIGQIGSLISNVLNTLNVNFNLGSVTGGGGGGGNNNNNNGGVITGSVTIQLQNVFTLLQQLQTIASSGNTSNLGPILQTILAQLKSLQGQAPSSAIQFILATTSQLNNLLQQVQIGNININQVNSTLQNVTNSLNQLQIAINGGGNNNNNNGGVITGSVTVQLQHVFTLIQQLKDTVSSGNTSNVSSILQIILAQLQSLQGQAPSSILNLLSTTTTQFNNLQQQVQSGSFNTNLFNSVIQTITNTLNQIPSNISGGGGNNNNNNGGVITGSVTVQLQNVFTLIQQLKDTLSSGNTSNVSSLLQIILAQLQSLQGQAPSSILNLLSTITTQLNNLQQQVQNGNNDINLFNGVIQTITNNLNQIQTNISGGGGNNNNNIGGVITGTVTVQLQNVFTLLQQLQAIASSGNTSNLGQLLQTILAQLKSLQGQAPSSITNLLLNLTTTINTMQQQVQTGSFDINAINNFIQNVTNNLNQIQTNISGGGGNNNNNNSGGVITGTVTVQLQNVFTLLQQLQSIASSGNTSNLNSLLQTILAQLKSLQGQAPSSITNLLLNLTTTINTLQQQVQTGSFDINAINNFVQNFTTTLNQVQTTIGGGGNSGGGSTTTEISNLQKLVLQFQTTISQGITGNTQGINQMLNAFLQQLSDLQGTIKAEDSRNVIIALIGNIYTLQQSLQSGKADSSSFQFFIKNIQQGLQQVSVIESGGSSSGGGGGSTSGSSISNADISNVQSLFTQLQNILNSGTTQGSSAVLQQLVTVLQGFTSKVSDSNATKILSSIIANITQLQQQASSGNVNMQNFANLLIQSVNSLNQFIQVVNSLNVSGGSSSSSSGGSGGSWSWSSQSGPVVQG